MKLGKFGNKPTVVDGVRFDSQREARRWGELKLLEKAGEISGLSRQDRFPLHVNGKLVGHYVPDFCYTEKGEKVVEDVKSKPTITPFFRWKAKHMEAEYGHKVRIVF